MFLKVVMRKKILIIAMMGIFASIGWSCDKEAEENPGAEYQELHEGDPGWEEFE